MGTNPTFDGETRQVEAHVIGRTDLDLYGEEVVVEFVALLRPTLRFEGIDPLVAQMHADCARALAPGQPLVIRTLDAGSDKPLRFVTHPDESNPALGVRGDRIALAHPEIRAHQLDAIAQARPGQTVRLHWARPRTPFSPPDEHSAW